MEGESLSLCKLSVGPGLRSAGARHHLAPQAWLEQRGADREGWMPILVVLFVVLFFILSPLGKNLRLQGPRLRILKLSLAELGESNPQLLPLPLAPWLPPGIGFPR